MGDETNQAGSEHAREATRAAKCPRCGYDLEGLLASFSGSPPARGMCSECGYDFDWDDVLREDRQRVPWLYEHTPGWWRADSAFRTLGMALLPLSFWRRIQPHITHRPLRLALWPLLLIAAIIVVCTSLAVVVWFLTRLRPAAAIGDMPPSAITVWLLNLVEDDYIWTGMSRPRPFFPLSIQIIAFNAAALGACMLAPSHWRGRIRPVHLIRTAALGLTPAIAIFGFAALLWCWRMAAMPLLPARMRGGGAPRFLPWQEFPYAAPMWMESWAIHRANPADEFFALAWLLLWWWCALRIGLHVRQSFPLWLGAMIIALCVALLLGLQNGLLLAILWGL